MTEEIVEPTDSGSEDGHEPATLDDSESTAARPNGVKTPMNRIVLALLTLFGVVLAGCLVLGIIVTVQVAQAGVAGKRALLRAEGDVRAQRTEAARQDLTAAAQDFRRMQQDLRSFGPLVSVARAIPLVRVQVRAVEVFARAGVELSNAGRQLVDAAALAQKSGGTTQSATSLDRLRTLQASVRSGVVAIDSASAQLNTLSGYRLLGSLGQARTDLSKRLISIGATAHSADDGLTALIAFTGGSGPRRYLVLSQNPDELRPTGGFIGSFGVLTADSGQLRLEHYADIDEWTSAHPAALVPAAQLASPFRFYDPPLPQNLANVNAGPDWPQVAQAALGLWRQGGQDADGVVSFTPEFMAGVLGVVGPVSVPSYGETVTAQNVVERLDFYTHVQPPQPGSNRKAFLAPLGQAVMEKLVSVPVSQWSALATALARSFSARQLMVWSQDPAVESTLARRGWDGALPATSGDFFGDGEFEYAAKNGRGIKRSIDHQVTLRPDGSAHITTTITFANTQGPGPTNDNPLLYVTEYGPSGATLDASSSDLAASVEPPVAGHPAAGWFVAVLPNSTNTLKVTWDVPGAATRLDNGSWEYRLQWQHVVDNTDDTLNVRVELPAHGRWIGPAPPSQVRLMQDLSGAWTYRL